MAKFLFVEWLENFLFENLKFDWDLSNVFKIYLKHKISQEQVEACFSDENLHILGVQVEPATHEPRYGVVGKDDKGELIFVAFTIRSGKIRPISSRRANKKERFFYD